MEEEAGYMAHQSHKNLKPHICPHMRGWTRAGSSGSTLFIQMCH